MIARHTNSPPHDNRPGDRTCRASPLPSRETNLTRIHFVSLYHNGQYIMLDPEIVATLGLRPRQEVDEVTLGKAIDRERGMMRGKERNDNGHR